MICNIFENMQRVLRTRLHCTHQNLSCLPPPPPPPPSPPQAERVYELLSVVLIISVVLFQGFFLEEKL